MRIGIDAHALGTHAGGNETYMRELLESLRTLEPTPDVVAYVTPSAPAPDAGGFPVHRLGAHSQALRVLAAVPLAAKRTRADVLHLQYVAPPVCPCPYVLSIHDLVWRRHPELMTWTMRRRLAWLAGRSIRRAARVFALTETIRRDIADMYHYPLERIDVVQPAADPVFQPMSGQEAAAAVRGTYDLPEHFVLYAGALHPRKNVARLAAAVARLRRQGLPHKLVIAGPRIWLHETVLRQLERQELEEHCVFTGYVEQRDLPLLMNAAAAFAYMSLYEGFGLPVLEAMACGTPVLASTDAAIREVAGDAVRFCDPLDTEAIADGLKAILSDASEAARLREAGPVQARRFNRPAMAAAAMAGYRAALEGASSV